SYAGGTAAFENRIAQIESRVQAGISSGAIDRTEAANLRMELRSLRQTYRVYARNGLTQTERSALQARVRDLRQDLRLADAGGYGRGSVYAGERYDRDGNPDDEGLYDRNGNRIQAGVYAGTRYDSRGRIDPNGMYDRAGNRIETGVYAGTRYDSRGRIDPNGMYDRAGNRIDVGVYGQGGPYEPVDQYCAPSRGGIGGIFDDIFGGDDDGDCVSAGLSVGARASGNLYAVPSQYRYRYRDGNGVYYRSDGRQIYQIDARSNTVLRIYQIDR
ncbi:MAG TPA: hypothetical protein VK472_01640, partial [Allosphingosinicella sp.]|nr:hypothetical protein [Allosphingosinicella sp.]